jgi:hypothetical protein
MVSAKPSEQDLEEFTLAYEKIIIQYEHIIYTDSMQESGGKSLDITKILEETEL